MGLQGMGLHVLGPRRTDVCYMCAETERTVGTAHIILHHAMHLVHLRLHRAQGQVLVPDALEV